MKFRGAQWVKRSHLEMFLPIFPPDCPTQVWHWSSPLGCPFIDLQGGAFLKAKRDTRGLQLDDIVLEEPFRTPHPRHDVTRLFMGGMGWFDGRGGDRQILHPFWTWASCHFSDCRTLRTHEIYSCIYIYFGTFLERWRKEKEANNIPTPAC